MKVSELTGGDYVWYADSPCEVISRPSRSCSSGTRKPTIKSAILYAMKATTADQSTVTPTALALIHTWAAMLSKPGFISNQLFTKPGPPSDGALNTPVNKAPRIPPTACTPKTSSVSSAPSNFFRPFTPHRQTTPAARPITNAPGMPTLPAAGVMATSPATAPDAAPSMEGLPLNNHSANIHDSTAQAVAK